MRRFPDDYRTPAEHPAFTGGGSRPIALFSDPAIRRITRSVVGFLLLEHMKSLDELRRTDPKWAAALDRVIESVVSHLLSQRIGGLSGKLEVTLNHSASVLKAEVKPTQVFTS